MFIKALQTSRVLDPDRSDPGLQARNQIWIRSRCIYTFVDNDIFFNDLSKVKIKS